VIQGLHHVAIATADLERFVDCYKQWFGFEDVFRGSWNETSEPIGRMVQLPRSAAHYAMLRLGNTYIEAFQYTSPEGTRFERRMCDPGLTHICLHVDDILTEYQRLRALGMEFHCPPRGSKELLATYGRDCDGNVVELLQVISPEHPFPYLGQANASQTSSLQSAQ